MYAEGDREAFEPNNFKVLAAILVVWKSWNYLCLKAFQVRLDNEIWDWQLLKVSGRSHLFRA